MYATIDTLQITKRLQKKGLKTEAAEEIAEILKERESEAIKDLVTKTDLRNEIRLLEQRITIKMGTMIIAAIAIITWLDKIIQ